MGTSYNLPKGLLSGIALIICTLLATPNPSSAQVNRAAPPITQDITVDEKLGDILDLSYPFLTSTGDTITLADLADPQKPILLNPLYYDCPILCNLVLDRVAEGIAALDWTSGKEFTIVSFSIDSTETPADAQNAMERLADLGIPLGAENGWAFLTAPARCMLPLPNSPTPSAFGTKENLALRKLFTQLRWRLLVQCQKIW